MSSLTPGPIGFILKMFPRLSETFILNEILELESQGVALRIFSLRRPADSIIHADAQQVRAPIHYLPQTFREEPTRVLLAHWASWRRYGSGYRKALRHVLRKARTKSWTVLWMELSQACCILHESGGATSFHAHFANLPAKIALLIHRISGLPYSVTTHAKDLFLDGAIGSPHVQERLQAARLVVANSQFTARHVARHVPGQTRIHTVYNGINLRNFTPRGQDSEEPLILGVGRLVEKKGFHVLVRACELLQDRGVPFRCELVGTGRLSHALKEQIGAAGLADCVHLIGPLAQEALQQRYRRAMICALPCIEAEDGDRDILPNVLKEAMAIGIPVVTSQLPGIEELVEHAVNGLLTAPGDAQSLADCLQLLLADRELRCRLARQGRKVIEERFDRRRNFAQLRELLDQPSVDALAQPSAIGVQIENAYASRLR